MVRDTVLTARHLNLHHRPYILSVIRIMARPHTEKVMGDTVQGTVRMALIAEGMAMIGIDHIAPPVESRRLNYPVPL
jgi:hypothetical protein